jgi:hypothetical protein
MVFERVEYGTDPKGKEPNKYIELGRWPADASRW